MGSRVDLGIVQGMDSLELKDHMDRMDFIFEAI